MSADGRLPHDRGRDVVGADRASGGVERHEYDDRFHQRASVLAGGDELVEAGFVDPALQPAVDKHRRGERAIAETEHLLEGHRAVGRRAAEVDGQVLSSVPGEPLGTHGLAGFPAAHVDHRCARWFGAKILVEGDDTVDLGLGQVQLLGYEIDGPRIDVGRTRPAARAGSASAHRVRPGAFRRWQRPAPATMARGSFSSSKPSLHLIRVAQPGWSARQLRSHILGPPGTC